MTDETLEFQFLLGRMDVSQPEGYKINKNQILAMLSANCEYALLTFIPSAYRPNKPQAWEVR